MLLQLSFYSVNHGNPSLTVANQQLRGSTDLEKAQIIQWFGFADSEILPASCTWVFPCLGIMQYNKVVSSDALLVKSVVLTALTPDYRTRMFDISCVIHVIVRRQLTVQRKMSNWPWMHWTNTSWPGHTWLESVLLWLISVWLAPFCICTSMCWILLSGLCSVS